MKRVVTCTLALLVLLVAPGSAYVLKAYKWSVSTVPFYVNPSNADIPASDAIVAVRTAAETWNAVGAGVSLAYAGATSASAVTQNRTNEMFFRDEANGSLIAQTMSFYSGSTMVEFDTVFYDAGFTFYGGDAGCVYGHYVQDAATHELGHALTLAHSAVETATMWPTTYICSQAWRTLDPDDVDALQAQYPATTAPDPPPTDATAPQIVTFTVSKTNRVKYVAAVEATDNVAVTLIQISLDGQVMGQTSASSYRLTVSLSPGTHAVSAHVLDAAGNAADATLSVTR